MQKKKVKLKRWQPSATEHVCRRRAEMYHDIREFFRLRNVLEVETPLCLPSGVSCPYLHSFRREDGYFLQTSPEYAMKRLLASGFNDCYQITKAFRKEESGKNHNSEFTLLEWYRIGYDHHQLMKEIEILLKDVAKIKSVAVYTYQDLFLKYLDLDPLDISEVALVNCVERQGLSYPGSLNEPAFTDNCLNFLMACCIEPALDKDVLTFVYDFPATQAALAKISVEDSRVAHRFECYWKGLELANGFFELTDAKLQRERFEADNHLREKMGFSSVPLDEFFLAALEAGLPECAGVALGLDRLLMGILDIQTIQSVLTFPEGESSLHSSN